MRYVIDKKASNHVIITLHGTGGSATDLFNIAEFLDKDATKIGFEGPVLENGMRRYFARYPQGGFDLESLSKNTDTLYEAIFKTLKENNLEDHVITIIGYSNGANIAKNIIKKYKDFNINNMVLFHPSNINPIVGYKSQAKLNVLLTSGKNDPYISEDQFEKMQESMQDAGINIEAFSHNQGHQLTNEELAAAKDFISKVNKGLVNG